MLKKIALTVISLFIISAATYKLLIFINNMKKKLISLSTLSALMMATFEGYHHHELDINDQYACNQECIDVANDDHSHDCDFCKFGFTKYTPSTDNFLENDTHSNYFYLNSLNFVSYKSVHGIPNKSPPTA